MSNEALPEELIELLSAIAEDGSLRSWLLSLHALPPAARSSELGAMAERMRQGDEDTATISAVAALGHPAVYEAAYQALSELQGS